MQDPNFALRNLTVLKEFDTDYKLHLPQCMSVFTTDKSDDSGVSTQAELLESNNKWSQDERTRCTMENNIRQCGLCSICCSQFAAETLSPVGGTAGKLMRRWSGPTVVWPCKKQQHAEDNQLQVWGRALEVYTYSCNVCHTGRMRSLAQSKV